MKKIITHCVWLCLCLPMHLQSQSTTSVNVPVIGSPCPDLLLEPIQYFARTSTRISDFHGKGLILDFWTIGCSACVESFPKLNALQKEFAGQVQIILIGMDYAGRNDIRRMFERFRTRQDLELPFVYDSVLFKIFNVSAVPHLVWIDEKGIVQALTTATECTPENLKEFIDNKNPFSKTDSAPHEISYDPSIPLLMGGNGGPDSCFLFRSVLTKWDQGFPVVSPSCIPSKAFLDSILPLGFSRGPYFYNMFQTTANSISSLYDLAYGDTIFHVPDRRGSSYGSYWSVPLLETKDSDLIRGKESFVGQRYCYSVIVPRAKASATFLQQTMQRDLDAYFGYSVKVTYREMPCWKLIADAGAPGKLQTKGGPPHYPVHEHDGITIRNASMSVLISSLWDYFQQEPPFIDETGIKGNVDLYLDAIMTDMTEIQKALRQWGLRLVKSTKPMKVIIIRDKLPAASN